MKIYWASEKKKKSFAKLAKANARIEKRMTSMKAAKNFLDLVPQSNGRAHFLKGDLCRLFALDLYCKENPHRYICEPYGDFETDSAGNYKKDTITEFVIKKIENNYHKD